MIYFFLLAQGFGHMPDANMERYTLIGCQLISVSATLDISRWSAAPINSMPISTWPLIACERARLGRGHITTTHALPGLYIPSHTLKARIGTSRLREFLLLLVG